MTMRAALLALFFAACAADPAILPKPPVAEPVQSPKPKPTPKTREQLLDEALALMDNAKFEEAERILGELSAADQENVPLAALREAALTALRQRQMAEAIGIFGKNPVTLDAMLEPATTAARAEVKGRSDVTFDRTDAPDLPPSPVLPELMRFVADAPPDGRSPIELRTVPLVQTSAKWLAYSNSADTEYWVPLDANGKASSVVNPALLRPDSPGLRNALSFRWIEAKDGVLFVERPEMYLPYPHNRASPACIAAYDEATGRALWRSEDAIGTGVNFVLYEGVLVALAQAPAGSEIVVMDAATGVVKQRITTLDWSSELEVIGSNLTSFRVHALGPTKTVELTARFINVDAGR